MSVKVLVEMNLSPDWVTVLPRAGWRRFIGPLLGPRVADRTVMDRALANDHIVFTHGLDFGTTLALTRATGPSVLQIRGQNVLPDHMEKVAIGAVQQHDADLAAGAVVVVDEAKCRVRILPII